jgi:hypothetical protein
VLLAIPLHHFLNLRWCDVGAVKGGDSVLTPHICLLGKRIASLRLVLREAVEFNLNEALDAAGPGSEELALSL